MAVLFVIGLAVVAAITCSSRTHVARADSTSPLALLEGETLQAFFYPDSHVTYIATCDPAGQSTIEYDAVGNWFNSATGPYGGTFTAHGSLTFGPQVTPPPVNMGFNPGAPPLGRVTAWQESFTITSGATTITGTAALDDSALTMEGWFSYGVCVDRAATYGPQTLDFRVLGRYSATITSPAGSVRDQGAMQAMILPAYDANQPQTVIQLAFLSNLVTASTPPRDSTPPTFVGVKAIVVDAKSPAGAVVRYDVTATDEIDPQPTVACTPASGGTFPIGSTTVECSARDAAGNADVVRFAITVLGAQDQLTAVHSQVAAVTPAALARALGGLADDALQSLRLGSKRTACVDLQILAAQASARPGVGGDVAVGAERIRRVIGC